MNIYKELLTVARNFCEAHDFDNSCRKCKRFAANMISIEQAGTHGGYDCCVARYTNKAAGVELVIDYDIMRGHDNSVLMLHI